MAKLRVRDKNLPDNRVPKKMLPGRKKLKRYRIAFSISTILNLSAGAYIVEMKRPGTFEQALAWINNLIQ